MKTPKQLERYFKGLANHKRISILLEVEQNNNLTVDQLTGLLKGNFKTVSQHTKSLVNTGLLNKNYSGRNVCHSLSPYGRLALRSIKSFY